MSDWRADVLRFWFALDFDTWWNGKSDLDHRITERFRTLWSEKRQLPADAFLSDPLTAIAAVILFDQFPRNMFRGHADQFSTDLLALAVAKGAVSKGFDEELTVDERAFLCMPFQHSEALADQDEGLLLFARLPDQRYLTAARKHRDIIARFGRFPHRNAMLGRTPRPDEVAAGNPTPF